MPYPDRKEVGYAARHAMETFVASLVADGSANAGLITQRTNDSVADGKVDFVSSNAGDTTQTLTLHGLNNAGAYIAETVALNGTTPVQTVANFRHVLGVTKSAATLGTVTVSADTAGPVTTTLFTLAAGVLSRGMQTVALTGTGVATVGVDTNTNVNVVLLGTDLAGAAASALVNLATAATTPVATSQAFGTITAIVLGDVAAARTVTVSAKPTAVTGIPFEPAIVSVHDAVASQETRLLPGGVKINLNTGAAAAVGPVVSADGADAWKVTVPFTLAKPGNTLAVVCEGFRSVGGSL